MTKTSTLLAAAVAIGGTAASALLWGGLSLLHAHEVVHDRVCTGYAVDVHGHSTGGTIAMGGLALVAFLVTTYMVALGAAAIYRSGRS